MVSATHNGKLEIKRPDVFQVAIRFHSDHPLAKALIYRFSPLIRIRVVLNETGLLIRCFHQYKHILWLLKIYYLKLVM